MTGKPLVSVEAVAGLLTRYHADAIDDLVQLSGGYWSAAFAYRRGGDEFVVRFGRNREWFEVDQAAHEYSSAALPVPRVHAIGDASDDLVFAISERAHGVFLEDQAGDALKSLVGSLFDGLRAAPPQPVAYSWHDWLRAGLDPAGRNASWIAAVARDPLAGPAARRAIAAIDDLLAVVPQRNDLVHGDLLHKNVLVALDLSRVNAVFSWKCSARGDALYDAAWLAFWGPWYAGIGALDAWSLADDGSPYAAERFRCYQLHIGATHLNWYAQTSDPDGTRRVVERLDGLA